MKSVKKLFALASKFSKFATFTCCVCNKPIATMGTLEEPEDVAYRVSWDRVTGEPQYLCRSCYLEYEKRTNTLGLAPCRECRGTPFYVENCTSCDGTGKQEMPREPDAVLEEMMEEYR